MLVEHSSFIKYLAYVCAVILIPIFLGGAFAFPYIMLTNDVKYELGPLVILITISIVLAVFLLKSFYVMIRFLSTLNSKIEFDEKGIVLFQGSLTAKFSWSQLLKSKDYRSCQIFALIDNDGKHLFSIWEYAIGYKEFRKEALVKIGI